MGVMSESSRRGNLAATLRGAVGGICFSILASYLCGGHSPARSSPAIIGRFLAEEGHGGSDEYAVSASEHEVPSEHGAAGFEHHEEEEEEEEIDAVVEATAAVCVVAVLILLTIAFEEIKERIEEEAEKSMRPVIESLFGEMTVLGFLSAFTFVITKTSLDESLSKKLFGEHEGKYLVEIIEMVHFCLFFIMIFFVLQVLTLMHVNFTTETEWLKLDRACRYPDFIANAKKNCKSKAQLEDQLLFYALRKEFILERFVDPPFEPADEANRVPDDFNFGRYLSLCLGNTVAHVVHVDVLSWSFFLVFLFVFYGLMIAFKDNEMALAWIWVGIGWLVFLFMMIFRNYLRGIRKAFAPSDYAAEEGVIAEDAPLKTEPIPSWCKIDLDAHLSKRSWLMKLISPATPTRQDALFWLEKRGPKLHSLILQVRLVFNGIYGALLLLSFYPTAYAESSVWVFVLYVALSLIPLLSSLTITRRLVATMSQVACIGSNRQPQIVSDVIREEKTARVVRAFIVLDKMSRLASADFAENGDTEFDARHSNKLDHVELAEVGKTFDAFDESGDGNISTDELERLMYTLGSPLSEESLGRMMSALDQNGDGLVSKEEFLEWYRHTGDGNVTLKDRAHALFALFDKKEAGVISMGDFKTTLDAFNIGFSVDEVGEIVKELDEDNDIMIGVKEFEELLERYYPKELDYE